MNRVFFVHARVGILVVGLAALLASAGCHKQGGGPPPAPPEVVIAAPTEKSVTEWDEYPGRVQAVQSVEIRARVGGYLQSVNFRDGADVEEGALLFVIDPRPYRATLKAAEAGLAQAKARVETSAVLLKRVQAIKESGAVSQDTLDTRLQDSLTAQADLQSAQAAVDSARLDMGWTHVRAPISGRLGRRLVVPGDLVEGSTAGSTLLTTIVSENPVYFYFTVDEAAALRYARNWGAPNDEPPEAIRAELIDELGTLHEGHVDFVDNRIDEKSGTQELRVVFPNDDGHLIPGMFGTVRIPNGAPREAILIPDRAIMADQMIQFVFVVGAENLVERRTVQLGPVIDGLRLIRDGLEPDDRVIIEGTQRARPGSPVTPTEETPSGPTSEPSASQ
ncbi:MAG: efflux RND transporter periplasmic adaptor subunit [Polyangiales bacterium]